MKKIRILCLHGGTSNKEIMEYQLRPLSEYFKDTVQFVAINGYLQIDSNLVDPRLATKFEPPFLGWVKYTNTGSSSVLKSVKYIAKAWNVLGPFDGILGFCQGTLFSRGLLDLASQQQNLLNQPLKFVINIASSFLARTKIENGILFDPTGIITVPSFQIIGVKDFLFPFSIDLLSKFVDPVVYIHSKGHQIPKDLNQSVLQRLKEFILEHSQKQYMIPKL